MSTTDARVLSELCAALAVPGEDERLHERLEVLAERAGLLDIAFRSVDSPVGPLLLAATQAGLVRVAFESEDHALVLQRLASDVSPRILESPRRLDGVARQLDEYFAGKRRAFDAALDLRLARGFRRSVLEELRAIPYGKTRSYAQVARAAGRAAAVRAAASACAQNPLPLVVPCHRVVKSDGQRGGYRGGAEAKELLLALEARA